MHANACRRGVAIPSSPQACIWQPEGRPDIISVPKEPSVGGISMSKDMNDGTRTYADCRFCSAGVFAHLFNLVAMRQSCFADLPSIIHWASLLKVQR